MLASKGCPEGDELMLIRETSGKSLANRTPNEQELMPTEFQDHS